MEDSPYEVGNAIARFVQKVLAGQIGRGELSVRFGAKRRETVPVSIKRKLARTRPPSLGSRVQGVEE
jgi:hypothetical protein